MRRNASRLIQYVGRPFSALSFLLLASCPGSHHTAVPDVTVVVEDAARTVAESERFVGLALDHAAEAQALALRDLTNHHVAELNTLTTATVAWIQSLRRPSGADPAERYATAATLAEVLLEDPNYRALSEGDYGAALTALLEVGSAAPDTFDAVKAPYLDWVEAAEVFAASYTEAPLQSWLGPATAR